MGLLLRDSLYEETTKGILMQRYAERGRGRGRGGGGGGREGQWETRRDSSTDLVAGWQSSWPMLCDYLQLCAPLHPPIPALVHDSTLYCVYTCIIIIIPAMFWAAGPSAARP